MTEVKAEEAPNASLEEENEPEESVYSEPNAAVIVSFLENFGNDIFPDNVPIMSDLMDWLANTDEVTTELHDIHVKLLRKLKRSVVPEKWEKAIIKFCYFYGNMDDAFQIERYGYLHSDFKVKLRILKNLLEMQFDVNVKFKNIVNSLPSQKLRLEPFGRDKDGNVYYCHIDEKANVKVYQENTDEETWSVVANNRDELAQLIDELKGHKPIRPFLKDLIDEDSSSNSRLSAKEDVKTEVTEIKPAEQEYSIDNSIANDEFPLKQTIRLVKKVETPVKEESNSENNKTEAEEDEKSDKNTEKVAAQKKRRRK
ncbi:remodeling and spacing factor 1-like [Chironomus tepperi]|uniref:remodeling and spacing factor 1-like n=1 Tax=Chironomus tepperi TaxID=113505 RepID=UPI00391F8A64